MTFAHFVRNLVPWKQFSNIFGLSVPFCGDDNLLFYFQALFEMHLFDSSVFLLLDLLLLFLIIYFSQKQIIKCNSLGLINFDHPTDKSMYRVNHKDSSFFSNLSKCSTFGQIIITIWS